MQHVHNRFEGIPLLLWSIVSINNTKHGAIVRRGFLSLCSVNCTLLPAPDTHTMCNTESNDPDST